MGEVLYEPLIRDMTWSYSRVSSYDDCPYEWFRHYIADERGRENFYASYGSFMHEIIEKYYKNNASKEDLLIEFLTGFSSKVLGERPKESTVDKYIKAGINYIKNMEKLPMNIIGVEEQIKFNIGGIKMVGKLDIVAEKDGEIYIIDNKSRDLKPRSNRKTPTQLDLELDEMLKQLYIYSEAVRQKYGRFPGFLCFNCFKNGQFIVEKFNKDAFDNAMQWLKSTIEYICKSEDFRPFVDFFYCKNLCAYGCENCCYAENEWPSRQEIKGW